MTNRPIDPPGTRCAGGVAAALARIRTEVRDLTATLWAARRSDELMDTVAEIEALKSTLDAVELQAVRELEATDAVKPTGWASTQDFVTAVAGGHKSTGPAIVRLAKAVETPLMTRVGEAMADGWLSTAKARVIQRAIDDLPGNPELRERGVAAMLAQAKALDATDLAKVGRWLVDRVDPDGEERRTEKELAREERAAHLGRELSIRFDGAGGAWIKGRCSSEDGARLRATLLPLARPVPNNGPVCDPASCDIPGCGHDGRDPRDHGARMCDALIELCDRAAAVELLPECHGSTPRVSVTIDFEDLKRKSGYGTSETGEDLSAETVRRMACDADIIPIVLGTRGEVLDIGHHLRLASTAIWKALVARDKHCRFPNCTRPPIMCHAHHIVQWCDGGKTSLENMILLCGHHHRLIHAGPWEIRRTGANSFAFDPPPGIRRMTGTGHEPPDQ
ncbi:MAG: DUF222 domain-containing protein [Marmoricola sp.]